MELLTYEKIILEELEISKKKIFYKHDFFSNEVWISEEILVQLNITPRCPLNCSFCYIKRKYKKELKFEKIIKLFKNLEEYYKRLNIKYKINLTGGDIFYYYKIE